MIGCGKAQFSHILQTQYVGLFDNSVSYYSAKTFSLYDKFMLREDHLKQIDMSWLSHNPTVTGDTLNPLLLSLSACLVSLLAIFRKSSLMSIF